MRVLCVFLCAVLLFSQTKLNLPRQAKGSPISPSGYFSTATWDDGKVTLLPGPWFNSLYSSNTIPPPNSQAICGRPYDKESHPTYEFVTPGRFIQSGDYIYLCWADKTWRRVMVEKF